MNEPTRTRTIRGATTLALLLALAAPANAESAREIARGMRVNQQALQDFSWKSRTELKVNGKTKDVQLFDVRYDMDGGLLKRQAQPESTARQRKTSRRGQEPSPELKALVDAYTHLTPVTLKEMFGKATIHPGAGDDAELIRVQAEGVRSLGDRVDLWVDRQSRRPRRSEIVTTIDGRTVRIETEFAELNQGPSYPARTRVHTQIKTKPAVLSIENFEFTLEGG
jgi:hypothetical protein